MAAEKRKRVVAEEDEDKAEGIPCPREALRQQGQAALSFRKKLKSDAHILAIVRALCRAEQEVKVQSRSLADLHLPHAFKEEMIRPLCGDCKTLCHIAKVSSKMICSSCPVMLKSGVALTKEEGESHLSSTASTQVFPAVDDNVQHAVVALQKNLVIAVPTDTLYGLAGDACSEQAIKKIYSIKGRNTMNPLAVCLAQPEDFKKYSVTSHLPDGLLQDLFPGPVTAVLLRGEHSLLSESLNPGLCSIGIRIPDSIFIRQVVEAFGGALALTSANISGQSSTIRIQEFESLWSHCAAIFDAGELPAVREGSTIVDLTVPGSFKILRPGSALEATVATLERHGLSKVSST